MSRYLVLTLICHFLIVVTLIAQEPEWDWVVTGDGGGFHAEVALDDKGNVYFYTALGSEITLRTRLDGTSSADTLIQGTPGSGHLLLAKYDITGQLDWAKLMVSSDEWFWPIKMMADADGNWILTGNIFLGDLQFSDTLITTGEMDESPFMAKYDSLGNFIWAELIGDGAENSGYDAAIDDDGNLLISGNQYFQQTYGDTTITSDFSGGIMFTAKYSPDGQFIGINTASSSAFTPSGYASVGGGLLVPDGEGGFVLTAGFN